MRVFPGKKFLNRNKLNFSIAIYLLILSVVLRLPFLFPAIINPDESTFILMGQSILDGNLPYTTLWDNKPPLAFVFYALSIALFGKSILSIRIAGSLCIASVAFFIYLIGKKLWTSLIGIIGATLFLVFICLLPSGQATMTEHVALVPLVGALTALVTQPTTLLVVFFSGIFVGIATLIRLNLAYVTLIIGLFLLFIKPLNSKNTILQRALVYSAGVCLVILMTYIPYLVTGNHQVWITSVVLAPLRYANFQSTALEILKKYWQYIQKNISDVRSSMFGISLLMWGGSLLGIGSIVLQLSNCSKHKKLELLFFAIFFMGTGISILKGGASHTHYLMQLSPFMALATVAFLDIFLQKYYLRWFTIILVVFILWISVKPVITEYESVFVRLKTNQQLSHGAAYEIADYLRKGNISEESIYMMNDHIVYWFVDKKPLTPLSTHPSNIAKDYLSNVLVGSQTSTEEELDKILIQKPKFIVRKKGIWYLHYKTEALLLLDFTLERNYQLVKEIGNIQIYRRKT